jgi:hypothetical protein
LKRRKVLQRDDPRHPREAIVDTKLYLPYNAADMYEGGRSIFYHSTALMPVFLEQFGVKTDEESAEQLKHGIKILDTLDGLPSLDGFLVHDALDLAGIKANESYFDVTSGEKVAIHEFIRGKMELLVRAAYGGQQALGSKVTQLVDKVWEAKDIEAPTPLVMAMQFPIGEALAIFSAWKGIIFYSYEYQRSRKKREAFALWLKDSATPKQVVPRATAETVEAGRKGVVIRLRS